MAYFKTLLTIFFTFATIVRSEIKSFKIDNGLDLDDHDHDFMIVSLFNPKEINSMTINGYMEGAEAHLEYKVGAGEWNERSVVWLRAEIDQGSGGI